MNTTHRTPRLFLLYMLAYLLLMEWLIPLPEVSKTAFVPVFMAGAAFFFLVVFLGFSWWMTLFLMTAGTLFSLHLIFLDSVFFSPAWWDVLIGNVTQNVHFIVNGQWHMLTDFFRSMLFFCLLAIMSYLIYFWIVQARRILFFFIFTVIYIAVMDTFLPYDGAQAIVRIFVLGFVLMALLQWDRLTLFFPEGRKKGMWLRWLLASAALLIIAAGVGIAAPKSAPQWPDPVPFLESQTGLGNENGYGANNVRKIGYGDDDERLGGGFEMDDSPVFVATGDSDGYFRGEAKNIYTGHGWVSDVPNDTAHESMLYAEEVKTEEKTIEIDMAQNRAYDFVFYPGSLKSVRIPGQEEADVQVGVHSGRANIVVNEASYEPAVYTVTYEEPQFSEDMLQASGSQDPVEITSHYLQLPDDLPTAIGELAEALTSDADNRYDKVRAIEEYFHGPDFVYDTVNIAVPSEEEDYVEQFLFETQRGYCDNFSTSMAVMLRTLDIPTRWVKGFTKGDSLEQNGDRQVQEVTNAHAHSWVEVYFPDVGWVPFEPTRGFGSHADYVNETNEAESDTQEEEEEEETEESTDTEQEEAAAASSNYTVWPYIVGGILLIGGLVLFYYRFRFLKAFLLVRFKQMNNAAAFTRAFHALLWLLEAAGYKRKQSETLREYAHRLDGDFNTTDMINLTIIYEKIHYGKQTNQADWPAVFSVWENMVNRINA
ncbi:protein of unknown function [Alteribacillus persepolensis]|uniref:Transglutaminase-like domain-containing protein n=1 Tax=Alteribacillus persepolensis TaxID=568899 RepID=A0A1G8F7N9_9BACI|nr:DUF4129 domain-containing transglutaminase family protein [Alteribacillus persepolensis]SDH78120.1 protein of unknown function [Alteribacillus persepolensis]